MTIFFEKMVIFGPYVENPDFDPACVHHTYVYGQNEFTWHHTLGGAQQLLDSGFLLRGKIRKKNFLTKNSNFLKENGHFFGFFDSAHHTIKIFWNEGVGKVELSELYLLL